MRMLASSANGPSTEHHVSAPWTRRSRGGSAMSSNESLVREFLAAVGSGCDVERGSRCMADDVEFQMGGMPAMSGLGSWQQMASGFQVAFPDLALEILDLVAGDDTVAARWSWTATHTGDLMGIPASGKPVAATGSGFYKVRDGKIVAEWVIEDMMAVMQQIGAVPAPA